MKRTPILLLLAIVAATAVAQMPCPTCSETGPTNAVWSSFTVCEDTNCWAWFKCDHGHEWTRSSGGEVTGIATSNSMSVATQAVTAAVTTVTNTVYWPGWTNFGFEIGLHRDGTVVWRLVE